MKYPRSQARAESNNRRRRRQVRAGPICRGIPVKVVADDQVAGPIAGSRGRLAVDQLKVDAFEANGVATHSRHACERSRQFVELELQGGVRGIKVAKASREILDGSFGACAAFVYGGKQLVELLCREHVVRLELRGEPSRSSQPPGRNHSPRGIAW